jgi:hypothetical protein
MLLFMVSNAGAAVLDIVLNRKPTVAELIGNYKLKVSWGESTVQINANGTFQEEISESGNPAKTVSGSW